MKIAHGAYLWWHHSEERLTFYERSGTYFAQISSHLLHRLTPTRSSADQRTGIREKILRRPGPRCSSRDFTVNNPRRPAPTKYGTTVRCIVSKKA